MKKLLCTLTCLILLTASVMAAEESELMAKRKEYEANYQKVKERMAQDQLLSIRLEGAIAAIDELLKEQKKKEEKPLDLDK